LVFVLVCKKHFLFFTCRSRFYCCCLFSIDSFNDSLFD